jgi:hypothetical protein
MMQIPQKHIVTESLESSSWTTMGKLKLYFLVMVFPYSNGDFIGKSYCIALWQEANFTSMEIMDIMLKFVAYLKME